MTIVGRGLLVGTMIFRKLPKRDPSVHSLLPKVVIPGEPPLRQGVHDIFRRKVTDYLPGLGNAVFHFIDT
jgi:hypothetical protein